MQTADLAAVEAIAQAIHTDYPEDEAVFAERLRLYAAGCHVLECPAGIGGYVISHPWIAGAPPALDTLLGALPERPDSYYIHDLALRADARGSGAAGRIVATLAAHATSLGLPGMSLIAVGNSPRFWGRQGFVAVPLPGPKLASYGPASCYMTRLLAAQAQSITA